MTQDFFSRPVGEWSGYFILLFGFLLTVVIQIIANRRVFATVSESDLAKEERPISVLLHVRNASDRLENFLHQLLAQNYSKFEIVVIDDFSADSTLIILGVMAQKYPKIKFSSLNQENRYSEKMSMNLAMKAAKNDFVLMLTPETDLSDPNYLVNMNASLDNESQIVVSYINYGSKGDRQNRYCRLERLYAFRKSAASKAFGAALFYQQVNVLFSKKLYFDQGGFKGNMNAHYAGLELILNQIRKPDVKYLVSATTNLRESRSMDYGEYDDMMTKYVRLNRNLRSPQRRLFWFEGLVRFIVWFGIVFLLVTEPQHWFIYLGFPLLLFIIRMFVTRSLLKRLDEPKIFLSSVLYVFVRPFLYLFFRLSIFFKVQRK